jgi:hypothetical protein
MDHRTRVPLEKGGWLRHVYPFHPAHHTRHDPPYVCPRSCRCASASRERTDHQVRRQGTCPLSCECMRRLMMSNSAWACAALRTTRRRCSSRVMMLVRRSTGRTPSQETTSPSSSRERTCASLPSLPHLCAHSSSAAASTPARARTTTGQRRCTPATLASPCSTGTSPATSTSR